MCTPPLQDGPHLRQPGGDLGVPRGHSAAAAGELPPQPHPHRQDLPGVLPAPHQDVLQVSGVGLLHITDYSRNCSPLPLSFNLLYIVTFLCAFLPTLPTGCPVKLFPLGYLLFFWLLLIQIGKVGMFLKNSGNLLHDRHKNFEN